jgi:hypothetical protein
MKASESQAKFMALLDQRKLSLEDFLAITLRSRFQGLVDWDLKKLVLVFLSSNFSIPSTESLKMKPKEQLSSKGKYIRSAFKAAINYLDMDTARDEMKLLINEFLSNLKSKGFQTPNFTDKNRDLEPPKK